MKRALWCVLGCAILGLGGARPAPGYPTSLNIMPVADVMGARGIRVELESDGNPTPWFDGAELLLYTQLGVTDRLEVGLDVLGLNTGASLAANVKWQLAPESRRTPAVAVGLLDVTHSGALSDWYVVLSRDVGNVRLHAGLLSDDATRGMLGMEYWTSERTGVLVDWLTGPSAYVAVGVYREMGDGRGGLLYYGRNNTRAEGDFVALNLCWEAAWDD